MSVCSRSDSCTGDCGDGGDEFGFSIYGSPSCEPQNMFQLLETLMEQPADVHDRWMSFLTTMFYSRKCEQACTVASWRHRNYATVHFDGKQRLYTFERVYLLGTVQCSAEMGVSVEDLESKLADALASMSPLPPSCTASVRAHFLTDTRLRVGFYRVFHAENAPRLHVALCSALTMTHDARNCMGKAAKLVKYFGRMTEFVFGGAITAADDGVGVGVGVGIVSLLHFKSRIHAWLRATAADMAVTRAVIVGMDTLSRAVWKRHAKSDSKAEPCAEERVAHHVLSAAFAAVGDAFAAVYDVIDTRTNACANDGDCAGAGAGTGAGTGAVLTPVGVERVFDGVARRFALL